MKIDEAIARARDTQPTLNAFTSIEEEPAISTESGSLAGVPIGLKDLIDHRGRVTTCGSAFYRKTATGTATCVKRLESAGGVIVGRTGLHEWAFGFSSENPHWGVIHNPWNLDFSPGGSSGGSAVAVAAGITAIAIGTDTGGSVRVPAALCGTYGLKVTHDRIPLEGVFPLVPSVDTVGPLAKSVDRLAVAYRVMSNDNTSEPEPGALRLGVPQPWYEEAPISDEVAATFDRALEHLRSLGHEVHPIQMPDVTPTRHIIWAIAEEVTEVHREFRAQGKPYGEEVAARLDDAASVTAEEMRAGRDWQEMIRSRFDDAFQTVDLLVTPTVPVRSKTIGVDTIGDRHYRTVLSYFSSIVNHALHPALAMPIAGSGRPPLSLQAIGPVEGEANLLGFARHLESEGLVAFTLAEAGVSSQGSR